MAAILTSNGEILLRTIDGLDYSWAPATDLGSVRFEPAGLASVLHNLDGTLRHLVLDQEDR